MLLSRKRPSVDDDDERPSDSIYISNAGNRQHRNHLSRLPLDPHSTTSRNLALSPIHEEQPDMNDRVAQIRNKHKSTVKIVDKSLNIERLN